MRRILLSFVRCRVCDVSLWYAAWRSRSSPLLVNDSPVRLNMRKFWELPEAVLGVSWYAAKNSPRARSCFVTLDSSRSCICRPCTVADDQWRPLQYKADKYETDQYRFGIETFNLIAIRLVSNETLDKFSTLSHLLKSQLLTNQYCPSGIGPKN